MKQIIVGVIGYHQSGKTTLLKNLSCASKLITAPPLPLNNKSNIAYVPYFTSAFSKIATFFPLAKKVYPQIKFCEIDCYDEEQK